MSTLRALRGFIAVSATALLSVGAAGAAHAVTVVPGDSGDGRTVIVNNAGMEVEVVSVDRAAGTAQVTMSNNLGFDVYCEAANEDTANRPGGSISSARVVEMSAEYYQRFQNVEAGTLDIASGSVTMGFWPLEQLLPQGSVGDMASESVKLRSKLIEHNTKAKVDGLYGTTGAFRLNNDATVDRTITLGAPSTQPRGEDKVGFFTMCAEGINSAAAQGTAQLYAWSAFEDGWLPVVPAPDTGDGPGDGEAPGDGNGELPGDGVGDGGGEG